MALINLLPWREAYRQEKRKEFLTVLVVVLAIAAISAFSWYSMVEGRIENQDSRNQLLTQGIQVLDRELKEIKELKTRRKQWLERMEVIQSLQGNRAEIVKVFDEFARALPDGIFFTKMVMNGTQISLEGYAESNIRVSALMRQLDESVKFTSPDLKKIDADPTLGEQGSRFSLSVKVTKPASPTDDAAINTVASKES